MGSKKGRDKPAGSGAQCLLEPFMALKFLELLRAGNYLETAAGSVGIYPGTVRNWRKRGVKLRRHRPAQGMLPPSPMAALSRAFAPFADRLAHMDGWLVAFAEACTVAEADAESVAVLLWRRAMAENPGLAQKFLATRFPTRWGERPAVQVTTGPVQALTIIAPPEREP